MLHLFHKCALKPKKIFSSIDNLITSANAATVKILTRKQKFIEISIPYMPVVTRWGTGPDAVKYYFNNLQAVKTIIRNSHGDGILVQKCLDVINNNEFENDLILINRLYFGILALTIVLKKDF